MSATKTDRRAPAAVTTGAAEVPVLITEGQVRMGTAAVLGAPGRHRTVWRALVAAVLGRRRPRPAAAALPAALRLPRARGDGPRDAAAVTASVTTVTSRRGVFGPAHRLAFPAAAVVPCR